MQQLRPEKNAKFMPFLAAFIQFREHLLKHLHLGAKVFTLFAQLTQINCKKKKITENHHYSTHHAIQFDKHAF